MNEKRPTLNIGLFLIMAGLLLIYISLNFELTHESAQPPSDQSHSQSTQDTEGSKDATKPISITQQIGEWKQVLAPSGIFLELFKHIGVALFVVGFISCVLEVPHWTEYFKQRLADVVMDESYLEKLNDDEIKNLQFKTWKNFYPGAQIEREDSFLQFFENRIKKFIGDPYREEAIEQMIITNNTDLESYNYTTTITYVCRQVQGKLQDTITWQLENAEFTNVDEVKIELTLPSGSNIKKKIEIKKGVWSKNTHKVAQPEKSGKHTYIFNYALLKRYYEEPFKETADDLTKKKSRENNEKTQIDSPKSINGAQQSSGGYGKNNSIPPKYSVPLDAFNQYDKLLVKITAKGQIPRTGFIGWGMPIATKGFTLMCKPPENTFVRYELFGIDEDVDIQRLDPIGLSPDQQEQLTLRCDTWVLPGAGIAITFMPKISSSNLG